MRLRPRLLSLALLLVAPTGARATLPPGPVELHGPGSLPVAVLERPAVSGDQYAIHGRVACQGVEGDGYLEMWSVFADGSRYFSRTLAERGPMARLRGTSEARAFVLPFFLSPEAPRPVRLELNAVLPGRGTLTLSELALRSGAEATTAPGAWWSAETAGLLGGGAGSALGVFGALLGTLCSLGRGRRFVSAGLFALGAGGLVALAAGGVAVALGQPHEVWYPLVLIGGLSAALGFGLSGAARRRYEAAAAR
jgi:hypothetical protein